MIIDTDMIINKSKVLADLIDERMDKLTHKQMMELEKALEGCFDVIERRGR